MLLILYLVLSILKILEKMQLILLHHSSFSQFLMSKFDSFLNLLSSFEMSNITYFWCDTTLFSTYPKKGLWIPLGKGSWTSRRGICHRSSASVIFFSPEIVSQPQQSDWVKQKSPNKCEARICSKYKNILEYNFLQVCQNKAFF